MLAGASEARTGENPGCSKMEPLEPDNAEGESHTERKKALQVERRPHPDWQSILVRNQPRI